MTITTNGATGAGATGAAASNASTSGAAKATAEASDRFLTLLVTQLKNQDPLNPLDNAAVTTQMAQISTVSGINQLNDTVASLAASFSANQYLSSIGLVGHDVVVPGSSLALADGTARFGATFASAADSVKVTIKDEAGKTVRTMDLPAQKAGVATFAWDGKTDSGGTAGDGAYTFTITAAAKGAAVTANALTIAKVTGVAPSDAGAVLTLGSAGTAKLSDVLEIN